MSQLPKFRALIVSFGLLALSTLLACQSGPKVTTAVEEGPTSKVVVQTVESEAKVTAVDAVERTVTIQPRRGDPETLRVGDAAVNFDQIQVGDTVHAVWVEKTAVGLVRGGEAASIGAGAAVALAPVGAKPGAVMANTVEATGTVVGIDANAHSITLQFVDGSIEEFNVDRKRDLTQVSLGDSVRIQHTEAFAIGLTKH